MTPPRINVKIDRLIVVSWPTGQAVPREIPGFRLVRDTFVRSQTSTKTYARVRTFINPLTGTRLFFQYQPQLPGLPSFKLTMITQDLRVLSFEEIWATVDVFKGHRLLLVEVALDFAPEASVDIDFVRRHLLLGKSRPANLRPLPSTARYGSRKSDKLVRCYPKKAVSSFRVELEMHAGWLRRNAIVHVNDLCKLAPLLYPKHIRFVTIDWTALEKYLSRRSVAVNRIVQWAKAQFVSIHDTLKFLRTKVWIKNVHRFLVPLPMNREVRQALKQWSQMF